MSEFPYPLESFVATLARLLVTQGMTVEIAALANAKPEALEIDSSNWDGGTYGYQLNLYLPVWLFRTLSEEQIEAAQRHILDQCAVVLRATPKHWVRNVQLVPSVETEDNWREKARAWIAGTGITNQGRVRSDNIASRMCDGLLFRSIPEINLYNALKALGVSFAPLPVFIRGGQEYRRIEPDFILIKDGIILVVEVDGDTIHNETPVEAHSRTAMLIHEGAKLERVRASECKTADLAGQCARRLIDVVERYKTSS